MRALILLVCFALLSACSSDSSDEEVKGVIPQHQLDAMEKARNVEGLIKQADLERREEMDKEN